MRPARAATPGKVGFHVRNRAGTGANPRRLLMPLHIYHSRRYISGPKKGKVFRVKTFVGPYASMVLEAQARRGGKPIRLRGSDFEDFNFRKEP